MHKFENVQKMPSANPGNTRDAYKKMRRRSGKIELNEPQGSEDVEETELLKQEYIKLKQQLMQLQKKKHHKEKSVLQGQKSQRNIEKNGK